jgi:hypothetical protein
MPSETPDADYFAARDAAQVGRRKGDEEKATGSSGRDPFYDGIGDILTDVKTKKDVETVL